MNGGRVESTAGDFRLYAEGLTPTVAKAMASIDRVRLRIASTLHFRPLTAVSKIRTSKCRLPKKPLRQRQRSRGELRVPARSDDN